MAQEQGIGFSEATTDWQNYAAYRPRYPPSLVKLIMDHHRAHSNSLRLAHDAGSGSGIFVPVLAERFDHVHVSDPTAHSIALARRNVSAWYAGNWWKGKFTFSTTTAEDADQLFADGSVDFTSLMECMHWVDPMRAVEAVAKSLAPNGTLAIVYYHPTPLVVDVPQVGDSFRQIMDILAKNMVGAPGPVLQAAKQAKTGLDFVPLPEHLFIQDVTKRIYINRRGQGDMAFRDVGFPELEPAASQVGELQRKYDYAHTDPEAQGWRQTADIAWFRGFIASLQQENKMHLYEALFAEIDKAIKENAEDGRTVTIEWTVAVVLATRK